RPHVMMHAHMRMFRGAVTALLIAGSARADVITRVAGDAPGGGGSGAPSAMENDLIAWAGQPKAITLPELLQLAVRQAPPLQSAKLDIAIAEAQISETWERHAWRIQAQASGSKTESFLAGLANPSQSYGVTADLSRTLPTGGTVDLHVGSQYNSSTLSV